MSSVSRSDLTAVKRAFVHSSLIRAHEGLLRSAARDSCLFSRRSFICGIFASNQSLSMRVADPGTLDAAAVMLSAICFQPGSVHKGSWSPRAEERASLYSCRTLALLPSNALLSFFLIFCRLTGGLIRRDSLLLKR